MTSLTSTFLAIAGFLIPLVQAHAQESFRLDRVHCCAAQAGDLPDEVFHFDSTDAAEEVLRNMLGQVGLSLRTLKIRAAAVDSAVACVNPLLGDRLILYNEDFLRGLTEDSQSVWATRAIVAHELGHHLNLHLQGGDENRRRSEELEADSFAGNLLFRMGANEEDIRRVFGELKGGEGYPRNEERVAAAMNAWWRAGEQASYTEGSDVSAQANAEIPVDTGPNRQPESTSPSLSNLALLVSYNADVWHAGGGTAGQGMRFQLQGRLEHADAATIRVSIYFTFADGRVLLAHPHEVHYRTSAGEVATGSRPFPFHGGVLDLSAVTLNPIPYYVLNLVPTGFRTNYNLMARAVVFVDGIRAGETAPIPFFVNW